MLAQVTSAYSKSAVEGGNVFLQDVKDSFFKNVRYKSSITSWEHEGKATTHILLAQAKLTAQSGGGYS